MSGTVPVISWLIPKGGWRNKTLLFTYKLPHLSCILMILHPTSQLVFVPTRWQTFCDSLISPPTISESFVLLFNPPSLEEHMCAAIQIYDNNNNNNEKSGQMNRRFVTVWVFIPKGKKVTASRCRFCLWCISGTQREAAKHQIQIAWTCLHRALPACRPPGPLKPRTLRWILTCGVFVLCLFFFTFLFFFFQIMDE